MEQVLRAFGITEPILQTERLSGGRIHQTSRVTTAGGIYIVQRMHTAAFPDAARVMANIDAVTSHIRSNYPAQKTLHFYPAQDGGCLWQGWRVMDCIPGVTLDPREDAAVIRAAGEAFGAFVAMLDSLDPARICETIPGFHDTPARFAALDAAVSTDPLGRAEHAAPLLSRLASLREAACSLCRSDLPRRIVHNDTKCTNILFDPKSRRPVAVIDLDTVMPGLAAYDFGDAVRSLCGSVFDSAKYRAFADGYLAGASCLSDAERQSLRLGMLCVPTELAVRYLTDHLTGDTYFRHPDSLHRAEELTAFAESVRDYLHQ